MIKDEKEFYNYIRKEYKNMEDADKIPNFMKVYYELDRASSYEMNKFYYAVCNYIFLGIVPKKEILSSNNWKSIEPYAIEERNRLLKENGEV